ncbi:UNVERIFIED_CONTAM: hypothetical protein GTU68_014552 [Idotea baltica]|nr:hypothetical protein [Idotea baltica]
MAILLSQHGNNLILSARRAEELERVKAICSGDPDRILVLPMDMSERTGMDGLTQRVVNHFGVPDIMILNAGISNRSYINDTAYDVFERLMEVNFFGNVALSKAVLPHLVKRKSGHFVVISSLSGKFASPGRGAYSSSKHALHGYFDTLRMEHYYDNIQVLLACPGFIKTNVTKNSLTGDGSPQGKMDKTTANGMSAEEAATRILKATEDKKQEILFGGKERFGALIKRFFPSALTKIVLRSEKDWKLQNDKNK